MITEKRTLLTIITERALEESLLKDMGCLGVRGYTISDARGSGARGTRDAAWDEASNIRIEIVCTRDQAEKVLTHVKGNYYSDYAMISFISEVEVLRKDKF